MKYYLHLQLRPERWQGPKVTQQAIPFTHPYGRSVWWAVSVFGRWVQQETGRRNTKELCFLSTLYYVAQVDTSPSCVCGCPATPPHY